MAVDLSTLGKAVATAAADFLAAEKPTIMAALDTGITNAGTQVKAAIDKALTGHGALGLFTGTLTGPINAAIDGLATTGETDASTLFDEGVAALGKL